MENEIIQALVDDVAKIKNDIEGLKSFQGTHLKSLRNIATFIIMSTHNTVIDIIPADSKFITIEQLKANTELATKIVETTSNPLAVAIQYYNNCYDTLGKSGIQTITLH